MKVEDILAEIYQRKATAIGEERRKEEEKIEKEIKGGAAFKQAGAQLHKLLEMVEQHRLRLTDGGWVDPSKLKVEVLGVDAGKEFKQRQERLDKAFLDLKITLATAGKAEQQSLIRGFAEATF